MIQWARWVGRERAEFVPEVDGYRGGPVVGGVALLYRLLVRFRSRYTLVGPGERLRRLPNRFRLLCVVVVGWWRIGISIG